MFSSFSSPSSSTSEPEPEPKPEPESTSSTSSSSSSPSSDTPQLLVRSVLAKLTRDLDASDVLECYALVRSAGLHSGMVESENDATMQIQKMAIGFRYRPISATEAAAKEKAAEKNLQRNKRKNNLKDGNSDNNNNSNSYSSEGADARDNFVREITIEYGPQRLGASLDSEFMPLVHQRGTNGDDSDDSYLTWENEGRVYYTTKITSSKYVSAYYMAKLTGAVLGTILEKAVDYTLQYELSRGKSRRYQPFVVVSDEHKSNSEADSSHSDNQIDNNKMSLSSSSLSEMYHNDGTIIDKEYKDKMKNRKVLIKSASSNDFIQYMWRHLAELGVTLQPILPPPMYEVQLIASKVEKLTVGQQMPEDENDDDNESNSDNNNNDDDTDNNDRSMDLVTSAASFYERLYTCMKAITTGDYSDYQPPTPLPTMALPSEYPSALPSEVPTISAQPSEVPTISALPSEEVSTAIFSNSSTIAPSSNATDDNSSEIESIDNSKSIDNNTESDDADLKVTNATIVPYPEKDKTDDDDDYEHIRRLRWLQKKENDTSDENDYDEDGNKKDDNKAENDIERLNDAINDETPVANNASTIDSFVSSKPSTLPTLAISEEPSTTPTISLSKEPSTTPTISLSNEPSPIPTIFAVPTDSPEKEEEEEEETPNIEQHAKQAQEAATEATQKAEEAKKSATTHAENIAADAAQKAANAAQKAADATSSAAASAAMEGLRSGDGDTTTGILSACFSDPLYGIAKPKTKTITTTVVQQQSNNEDNDDWTVSPSEVNTLEELSDNNENDSIETTNTTITKTTTTTITTTYGYLYFDGSTYYRLNLTKPYLRVVRVYQPLPEPSDYYSNEASAGGDIVDWFIAFFLLSMLVVGILLYIQQVFGYKSKVKQLNALFHWQQRFFHPTDTIRHDHDHDYNNNHGIDLGGSPSHANNIDRPIRYDMVGTHQRFSTNVSDDDIEDDDIADDESSDYIDDNYDDEQQMEIKMNDRRRSPSSKNRKKEIELVGTATKSKDTNGIH